MARTLFAIGLAVLFLLHEPAAWAESPQPEVKETVFRGLGWLVKQQGADGSWSGPGGAYPSALTAMAGTALLAEGSTPRQGKYAGQVHRAVEWFLAKAQPNGLLVDGAVPSEGGRYLLGHGFGLVFLAGISGEEADSSQRERLQAALRKAVDFAAKAQTKRGGWGYVSAKDGGDFDEANATVTVLQGMWAARRAGITVPDEVFERASKYHRDATTAEGGVAYSLGGGYPGTPGRPTPTAGVAACWLMGGSPDRVVLRRWINFARRHGPTDKTQGITILHHYYFARVVHGLGEEGHRQLDPDLADKDWLRWSEYRGKLFARLKADQAADGSWPASQLGPVFQAALTLTILQLESNSLPVFAR